MLISAPTPCSSRVFQYMAHVMLAVAFGRNFVTTFSALDMLWATKSGYKDRVQQLLDRYTIKTVESGTFRFCGREVVSVRCKDTTEKIEPVRYDPKGRKQTDLARDHEIAQLRSVVGSLAWVARQSRPELSYGVNKLQSVCGTATLDDLRFANKLLQEAKESSDDRLFFKSGLFTWNKMEMLTITDASFGNESNFCSQKGRMTFLTGPESFDKNGRGASDWLFLNDHR